MIFKVAEIRGLKGLRALNGVHTLLIGVKMQPSYIGMSYEDFHELISQMPNVEKEKILRLGANLVQLEPSEVEAMLHFVSDPNGIPYSAANIDNLKPDEIVEAIVAVGMKISEFRVTLVTESEKKNLEMPPSI